MKSRKVLMIGGALAVVLTAMLVVGVFSMQGALAQKTVTIDEPAADAAEELMETPAAEVSDGKLAMTDVPEEAPAEPPEESAAQDLPQEVIGEEPIETEAVMTYDIELAISCFTQNKKNIKESEAVQGNWQAQQPGAADISRDEAMGIARVAAKEIFGLKDWNFRSVEFRKYVTGQRGSYWYMQFDADGLSISIDALSGNIACAYSESRRGKDIEIDAAKFNQKMNEIVKQEDSEKGGEYTAATKAIAEKYISGEVKGYTLNAVHGDGEHFPLVSIDVEMKDGSLYELEWSKTGDNGEIEICSLTCFPSHDHFRAGAYWDADLILFGDDPV